MSQAVYVITMKDNFDRILYTRMFTNIDAARKCMLHKVDKYNENIRKINECNKKYDSCPYLEKDNDDCFSVFSYGDRTTKICIDSQIAFDSFLEESE